MKNTTATFKKAKEEKAEDYHADSVRLFLCQAYG